MKIKVVRIFNTYGPRMHPNDGRVVSNFIMQALQNQDITIYGDGKQTRSFCYVNDLIDAMVRMMGTPDEITGPVNIGNPQEHTMLELAEMILGITGSRSRVVFKPLPQDDPTQRRPDLGRAKKILGWEPTTGIQDGLVKTVEYFESLLSMAGNKSKKG